MTDIEFKTYEEFCGGDGLTTKSIVPGVSMSKDIHKRYFNPHDETILTHTLTINYTDRAGNIIAEPTTMSIKYIQGVTSEIVVTPKNVDGYITSEVSKTVLIPEDSVINFVYHYGQEYPLTFIITDAGTIKWVCSSDNEHVKTISYSKNGGEWISITSGYLNPPIIEVSSGDTVSFKGDNLSYSYCGSSITHCYFKSTAQYVLEGNIMSLMNSNDFKNLKEIKEPYAFYYLFAYEPIQSADGLYLPATKLSMKCYSYMFSSCSQMISMPELPATTLAEGCYNGMFYDCTNLINVPNKLPATTLEPTCYYYMFHSCRSLTKAPELPAMTMAKSAYTYMFYGCKSLEEAPELPATTLANYCYFSMFRNCSSLAKAPELPATTLSTRCYGSMFSDCKNLHFIAADFLTTPGSNYTGGWVAGVYDTGIFLKNESATWSNVGYSGVPFGWATGYSNEMAASSNEIELYDESGETSIFVYNGKNTPWTASTSDNWLTLDKITSGEKYETLTINYTSTEAERTGSITLTNGVNNITINIIQKLGRAQYLTFDVTKAGYIQWICQNPSMSDMVRTISYSKNGGEWTEITPSSPITISVSVGDSVRFKGNNLTYYKSGNTAVSNSFCGTTAQIVAKGNIMSLFYGDNFSGKTSFSGNSNNKTQLLSYLFEKCSGLTDASKLILPVLNLTDGSWMYSSMFHNCPKLVKAPNLPATAVGSAYQYMFEGCTALTIGPKQLPSKTAGQYAYDRMFSGCTSLVEAPEILATTVYSYGCDQMFANCRSLVRAPELHMKNVGVYGCKQMFSGCYALAKVTSEFPVTELGVEACLGMFANCSSLTEANFSIGTTGTTMGDDCCKNMFQGCKNLTVPPKLPANTLKNNCYAYMFSGCTSLTEAPELPATTLVNGCYNNMFLNCNNLNYVKCLATDISADNCTNSWLSNVSETGTFVKNPSMTNWPDGVSGIPTGWTVQDTTI